MNRRGFIKAASGLFLSAAIVKSKNIMPVKPVVTLDEYFLADPLAYHTLPDEVAYHTSQLFLKQFKASKVFFSVVGNPDNFNTDTVHFTRPAAY